MYNELDKLNQKELTDLYKEIDKNYKDLKLPTIEPKYNKEGKITNEKAIKSQIKKILPIITAIWLRNKAITDAKSTNVMSNTILFYSLVKTKVKPSTKLITKAEWTKIINKTMKKRAKQVKINTVIKGNIRRLNKKTQKIIVNGYKNGKSKPQIAKELQKTMQYNKNKAKSIATTEVNYYKSEAQLEATKELKVTKTWVHNSLSKEPRDSHIAADGQTVKGRDAYFTVGGHRTQAPQHFGIASEDINCHCTMIIEVDEDVKLTSEEIKGVIK